MPPTNYMAVTRKKVLTAVAVMHTERKYTKIDGEVRTNRGIELSLEEGLRHLLRRPGQGSHGPDCGRRYVAVHSGKSLCFQPENSVSPCPLPTEPIGCGVPQGMLVKGKELF